MSPVTYTLDGRVARIRLTGERGNPLTQSTVDILHSAVRQARRDKAHVVVLSAEGKAFSVGGDVSVFAGAEDVGVLVDDLAEALHRTVNELHRLDAIVVSVVQGTAAGAGFPLAAAADLVLAAESARFTLAYTKLGFSPDGGSSLLTATVGLHQAMRLALLNPVLSAAEAHQLGLVAEVHPDDELAAAAERVVQRLAAGSNAAQSATKRLLRDAALPASEAALRRETMSVRACAAGPDGLEGVAAFLEKRPPQFPSASPA
ncbi:enoyl-CoA hydratase/isomerase family protein [Amycolatopsis panacis]|uniref:Enoyl-CoA hydratase n=1 Tax=Amycolatopsis panacis TaxID=2340917 RepID=A0A419HXA2_9PSEU|nr:enoyl-CoA hydratase-related protein [Amycolatopsis panacis]RJQ81631.1 enoyl-CoA hydratase [Amycolatopsis panacis]